MKKWYSLLKSLFLVTLLLICTQKSVMITQAEEDLSSKCGLAEFEVVYDEDLEYIPVNNKYSVPSDVRAYWTCFTNDYYYNQLTDAQREVWDALEEACISLAIGNDSAKSVVVPLGNNMADMSKDELFNLLWMFKYSNPQYYFLSNSATWSSRAASIGVYGAFQDGEARKNYTNMFCEKVNGWVAQVANAGREEEKVKLAHDIIADNTVYDSGTYDQSAFSMVCEGRTVCAGYAAALQLLLNPNGILTTEVTSATHAWNNVMVHGQWYAVDVTWDDYDWAIYYRYYLKSDASISYTNTSHGIEKMWFGYVPELKYDSVYSDNGWNYYSPYFTEGTYEYFTVNDNLQLDSLYAIVLNDDDKAPSEVAYSENTYRVLNVPQGRRNVHHYDIRVHGGDWDKNEMYYRLNGTIIKDAFFCDGENTYYLMADGTPMKDRLTFHPDGVHVIYFDKDGHEVFNNFTLVGHNIADMATGDVTELNEYCYFDGNGYQYTDVVTWGNNDDPERAGKLYYANTRGVLERDGWFTFSETAKYAGDGTRWPGAGKRGYANSLDRSLMRETWTYDENDLYRYMNGYGVLE